MSDPVQELTDAARRAALAELAKQQGWAGQNIKPLIIGFAVGLICAGATSWILNHVL